LLNTLTGSQELAEDRLFAPLDTRARRIRFPREREVVVTDTVGFIRELPKDLFAALRATFEEAEDADLLLHVVDAADPARDDHMEATEGLLIKLGLERVRRLTVFNKVDRLEGPLPPSPVRVPISAIDPATLRPLLERMESILFPGQ